MTDKSWKKIHLSNAVGSLISGAAIKPSHFSPDGVRVIHKGDVQFCGNLDLSDRDSRYVNPEIQNKFKNSIIDKSYLVVSLRDLAKSAPQLGLICRYEHDDPAILAQGAYAFKCDPNFLDRDFLVHISNSRWYRRKMSVMAVGSTQVHLRSSEFLKIELNIPTVVEQKRISHMLNYWDRSIEKTSELISKTTFLLDSLVNELYSGRKCFSSKEVKLQKVDWLGNIPKDWSVSSLRTLVNPVIRNVKKPNTPYLGLGIRSHGKGTFLKPNQEPEKIALEELFEVFENDLLVSITFGWEGAVAIAKKEDQGALTSHRFPAYIINMDLIDLNFLRYFIRTDAFVFMLGLISPGGAGRNRVLKKEDLLDLPIPLPSFDEQVRIGNFLNKLEQKIKALRIKKQLLISQKNELMDILLFGKKV